MSSYQELLNREEWHNFKINILNIDSYTCQKCKKIGFQNEIFIPFESVSNISSIFKEYTFDDKSFEDFINECNNIETYNKEEAVLFKLNKTYMKLRLKTILGRKKMMKL